MFKVLQTVKNPEVLVVTALGPGRKIDRSVRVGLSRNITPFDWVSYESSDSAEGNTMKALIEYNEKFPKSAVKYFIKVDDDLELSRNMIDRMKHTLEKTGDSIAYCYCSFKFQYDTYSRDFPAKPFDAQKLLKTPHISSVSLFKLKQFLFIGGFDTDESLRRLQDWATFIKMLRAGLGGVPCYNASFIARGKSDDTSAGKEDEYKRVYSRVYDKYLKDLE